MGKAKRKTPQRGSTFSCPQHPYMQIQKTANLAGAQDWRFAIIATKCFAYFAYATERVSRITVIFTCPG